MQYLETLSKVQELINSLLIVLSEKEKFIIENRFSLNGHSRLTLESIGSKFGVTRERIRQIEKNALKKLSRNVNNTQLRDLTELSVEVLGEFGGVMSEISLVNAILKRADVQETIDVSSLKLTVDLDKRIVHEHNTIRFRPFWRLSEVKAAHVKQVCEATVKELRKVKKVVPFDKLLGMIKDKVKFDGLTLEFAASACELDRQLKTIEGGVGLAKWRDINPKTLRDKIFYVFKQIKKPMHYVDISNQIGELDFDQKMVNTQAVHNELIRYPQFILIGRGIYALKEWGYEEGTVADVIERVLRDHKQLSRDEIVQKVLERRQVKKITILLNLKNKDQFRKLDSGKYELVLA